MHTVLVVEDEKAISDIVAFNLEKEGYKVLTAYDGIEGLQKALEESPDLILLDVMLPGINGFEICKKVREKTEIPIIMLTAREEEVDKILGLELGADDYITKPFSMRELLARVKANVRRFRPEEKEKDLGDRENVLVVGEISLDLERYEVKKRGKGVELTLREYELLKFLVKNKEKVFSREELLSQVWGYEYFGDVRTVDVTIRRLREKIENNSAEPAFILTKRGVGYYFSGI